MSDPGARSDQHPHGGWGKLELAAGILITLAAVFLHVTFLFHAGALWRDESSTVRVATLPAFGETWSLLRHESCPALFPVALRVWSAAGLGGTPFGVRTFGLLVGLCLLGAVWLNARLFTHSVPLISLGFCAANLAVVRWGDSLRPYGAGTVLILVTLAMVWRFVQTPTRNRWLVAAFAALLSVQCLFQNAFLVLAICLAGATVHLRLQNARAAAVVLSLGLPAALSLLPYLESIRAVRDWSVLSQTGVVPGQVWQNFSEALAFVAPWTKWLWLGLALAVTGRWARHLGRGPSGPAQEGADVTLFAATALGAGILGFLVFLWIAGLPTQVWYFLAPTCFATVCLDAALAGWLPRFAFWRVILAVLVVGVSFPKTLDFASYRQTNVDQVAARLRESASPQDLVLVHPWYLGITFDRYYRGPASWTTVPALADHRVHRYDLLKVKMQMEQPIQDVLDRVTVTLQAGHRVWLVGWIPLTSTPPPELRPAPANPWGWLDEPYSIIWGAQAGYLLATHSLQYQSVIDPSTNRVSRLENVPLAWVAGWQPRRPPPLPKPAKSPGR